jgi:hypothetical protein
MTDQMLASMLDELHKIAANMLSTGVTTAAKAVETVAAKPASVSTGAKLMGRMPSSTKPAVSYSVVNPSPQVAAIEASTGAKSVPPPPVRT